MKFKRSRNFVLFLDRNLLRHDPPRNPKKDPGPGRSDSRSALGQAFEFVKVHRDDFHVEVMCRLLGVSTSGYYAWLVRGPSARARQDQRLIEHMRKLRSERSTRINVLGMHAALRATGARVSRKRVARLMRQAGLDRRTQG